MRLSCLLLTFLAGLSQATYVLTAADIEEISAVIVSTFGLVPSYGTPCNKCPLGDNMGAMLRLPFHDAVGGGGPNGLGGANGCIDFTTSDNNGLEEVVSQYVPIFNQFESKISRADLWVLGANLAVQYASTNPSPSSAPTPPTPPGLVANPYTLYLPFRYGRLDNESCDGLDGSFLPQPGFNWAQIFGVFGTRIGMSAQEVSAIMGGHSLGRAVYNNSGFDGGWTPTQSTFSNLYFFSLGNAKWQNNNASNVWVDQNTQSIMLKVDVEPLYSPAVSCATFTSFNQPPNSNCTRNDQAGSADPYSYVVNYANSITAFYTNFATAYQKLTEFQYTNLVEVVSTPTPTATPTPTTLTSSTTPTPTTLTPTTKSDAMQVNVSFTLLTIVVCFMTVLSYVL